MIRGNNINRFLRGCSDHQDQLFCLFELKKASLALRMESRLEKIFSMGINIMSLAVWLGEDRKCSAAVVSLDLLLGLSMVRRCSLNRSFKRRFVSPIYCRLQRLH